MAKRGSFTPDDKSLCLKRFKKLKEKCRVSGKDIHLIEKAYAYAYEKHDGVRRKDGTRRSQRAFFTTRSKTRM